jgi:hypothetical protein
MREIVPGLWHWAAHHEPIHATVSSYYVQPAGIVIDPKVPDAGLEALPGRPQQVVLTSGHHNRDAQKFADTFGVPIRASHEAVAYLDGRLAIEPFGHGDEVAPGVTAIHIGKLSEDEGALHLTAVPGGAIALADGLNRYGGALGFVPDELLGAHPDRVKSGLKDAFRGLLLRDFEHLLFAHGEPIVGGAKTALRHFLESPVGYEEFGQVL